MNKLKGSLTAKIIAIILLTMSCLVLFGAVIGITWLDREGAYRSKSVESVRETLIEKRLQITCFDLLDRMLVYPVSSAYDSTVRFELLDENRNVLAGNPSEKETVERSHTVLVDGYYGEDTVEAVKRFQRDKGLIQDGKAGPATQRYLYEGDFPNES